APTFSLAQGATISPKSGTVRNFTTPQTYTVTLPDGKTQDWVVNISVVPTVSKSFGIAEMSLGVEANGSPNYERTEQRIRARVKPNVEITNLAPTFTLAQGATISPTSGTARDFTTPQIYTVTMADQTTQQWTVGITNESAEVIFDDYFSNVPNNNRATVGWTKINNQLPNPMSGIEESPDGGFDVLKIANQWALFQEFKRAIPSPQSGKILVEQRMRYNSLSGVKTICRLQGSGPVETYINGSNTQYALPGLGEVNNDANGNLTLSGKTTIPVQGGQIQADTWFTLSVLIDTEQMTMTAWIGDKPQQLCYVEPKFQTIGVGTISYWLDEKNKAFCYIDWVKMLQLNNFGIDTVSYTVGTKTYDNYEALPDSGETTVAATVKNRTGATKTIAAISALYDNNGAL
ncbi:MAG: hypothetical protein RR263_04955, partial [Oscillospiraceae bacterium]